MSPHKHTHADKKANTPQASQTHQPSPSPRSAQAMLLQLQKTAGNRAVSQLFRASHAQKTIQRQLLEYVPGKYPVEAHKTLDDDEIAELDALTATARATAKDIDTTVEAGRDEVQGVIDQVMDGDLSATEVAAQFPYSNGHARNFQNKLLDLISGQGTMHPSASGGYVIEDYASANAGGGVSVQTTPQNLRKSRPDFMITMAEDQTGPGGRDYDALLDVTSNSASSVGHILTKGGGSWVKRVQYPYVAESVYAPLDFGNERKELSEEEQAAAIERAREKAAEREELAKINIEKLKQDFKSAVSLVEDDLTSKGKLYKQFHSKRGVPRLLHSLTILGIMYNSNTEKLDTTPFDVWFSSDYVAPSGQTPGIGEKKDAVKAVYSALKISGGYKPY
ncbi:hypothetical protein [Tumebacillus permanentifrigoris]|uniref:Uncharacterized protein n=1 Tax=Tumebacillus permanentifrigoris TaxID=378543 RepID=A0A316DDJ2_9BACL|nr:hypothetical protein [Tumebacillus permanentifrigoris]PWK14860.1 hypothetical protein C7459_10459 [Tumebacillus permanentifrigoris]